MALFVPEQSPVTDRQLLLMQRPWLEWCRRVSLFLERVDTGGGVAFAQFRYRFVTSNVWPVNAQRLQFNADYPYTAVTLVGASKIVDGGGDVTAFLARIPVGARLYIQQQDDSAAFVDFEVTGSPTDTGLYFDIPVVWKANGTEAIANNATVSMFVIGSSSGGGGTGDVVGPASATADAIAVYSGTTGKLIKDSLKTIANVISDAVATILPGGLLPLANLPAHATRHQQGGTDSIRLDDLASAEDNTDLNATTGQHGLLPKLNNNALSFLNGQGAWATVSGSGLGDVTGPAGAVADNVALFDGTTGKIIKDTGLAGGNIAVKNNPNFFSSYQQITAAAPAFVFNDAAQPADQKLFQIRNSTGGFRIWAQNDGGATLSETVIDRAANLYVGAAIAERGRAAYLGEWIAVPYSAANFSAVGGTWTVEAADVVLNTYTLIGKTMIWAVSLQNTTMNTASRLLINLPGGLSGTVAPAPTAWAALGSALNTTGVTVESENATQLKIWKDRGGSGMGSGTNNCSFLFTAVVVLA